MAGRSYLGVDPGASGGLALILGDSAVVAGMPATEDDLWEWVSGCRVGLGTPPFAAVELVTGFVGGDGNTGSSQFKFGVSVGLVRMALAAAGIPREMVSASVWQREFVSPRRKGRRQKVALTKGKNKGKLVVREVGGESKTEFKNRLRAAAQRLFPGVTITLNVSDALLIAEWVRRKHEGRLG